MGSILFLLEAYFFYETCELERGCGLTRTPTNDMYYPLPAVCNACSLLRFTPQVSELILTT